MPRRRRNGGAKNRITNVRVVDPLSGSDGARMDRVLSSMQNSHSQIRVICGDYFTVNTSTSGTTTGVYTGLNVRGTDDYVSLSAQFETYRVTAVRFEVYDVNPSLALFSGFSTQHDVVLSPNTYVNPTPASVMDAPDASLPPAGGAKAIFNWVAHGTEENEFQSTANSGWSDFGGLRYFASASGSATGKYQVVVKAVVDFRGRI